MADRYWVGGTADWDGTAGTKWSLTSGGLGGETVPTAADDVFFDGSSTGTCTIAAGNTGAKSINCTGFTGTLTGTAAITVSGSVTLVAGMTYTYTGTLTLDATGTLTSAGKTLGSVTINGSGITVTLGDACTLGTADTFTLTSGTLAIGSNTLSTGAFTASGASTRSVTRSTGNITLTGNNRTIATITGSGLTMTGFTLTANYSGATGTRTFNITTQVPAVSITAGTDVVTFTSSNTIGALNFTGFSGTWTNVILSISGSLTVSTGMTVGTGANTVSLTATGTLTTSGKTFDFPLDIFNAGNTITLADALTLGSTRLLQVYSSAVLAIGNNNVSTGTMGITSTITRGTGNFTITGSNTGTSSTLAATSSASVPSGTVFTFTATGSTGFRSINTSASGFNGSIRVTGGTDTFRTVATSIFVDDWDMTGFAGTISFQSNTTTGSTPSITVRGSVTFPNSGITLLSGRNQNPTFTFTSTTSETIDFGAVAFPGASGGFIRSANFVFNGVGGTWTLQRNLTGATSYATSGSTAEATATLTAGSLLLNNFTLTTGRFISSNSNTRTLNFGSTGKILLTFADANFVGVGQYIWDCQTLTNMTVSGTPEVEIQCPSNTTGGINEGYIGNGTVAGGNESKAVSFTLNAANAKNIFFGTSTSLGWLRTLSSFCTLNSFAATLLRFSTTAYAWTLYGGLRFNSSSNSNQTISVGNTGGTTVNFSATSGTHPLSFSTNKIVAIDLNINAPGATYQLIGDVDIGTSRTVFLSQGTLALQTFTFRGGTFDGNFSGTKTLNTGTGNLFFTPTFNASGANTTVTGSGVITFFGFSNGSFVGGGHTYHQLTHSGNAQLVIFGSNTFTTLSNAAGNRLFFFDAGTTQTITNFNLFGQQGALITLRSFTAGSRYTLSKTSGTVSANWFSIRDCNVTGGAAWNAGGNSIDGGNNIGWMFPARFLVLL